MTQEQKRICAERLFDEIGLIDDRFITEAASPYAPKKSVGLRRFLVAAMSVTLTLCVCVGLFAIGKLGQNKSDSATAPENGNVDHNYPSDSGETLSTLSGRLDTLRADTEELKVSAEDIQLFGGAPSVIWKYSDEETYRVCQISQSEAERLGHLLEENKGQRTDGEATKGKLDGVWIATGDGRVISPYLEQTDGNTGYGEIFEYSPEYEPSEEFSRYLCDVIS